jgi:HAD superfamily hydrolase (TIGR01484 family)
MQQPTTRTVQNFCSTRESLSNRDGRDSRQDQPPIAAAFRLSKFPGGGTLGEYCIEAHMNLSILATDYDGTLAEDGRVSNSTLGALESLRRSRRGAILVTGRELPQLLGIFDRTDLFDWIVAENGALLYHPATHTKRLLTEPVPVSFVAELHRRGVAPVSAGDAIVATWRPQENTVREVIRELGLNRQIIFNKEAVMILPSGVDKASGMEAALQEMNLSWTDVVGIGDAENDLAFLRKCQCSAAVSNALESVKAKADFTTVAPRGDGVAELIQKMLRGDLPALCPTRHGEPMAVLFPH